MSPEMGTRSLIVAPPGPAGCKGSSWSLRCPGAGAKGCRGMLPAVPSAGVAALPSIPFSTRSILAPIDGRFPAGEGRCCPAGQEKWLFAEPGAGSSIDLWCLVRDQLGRSLAVPRVQPEPGLGGQHGNARLAERCLRDARELPSSKIHPAHPQTLPCLSFPDQRLFQHDPESGDAVRASWQPRGWAVPGSAAASS